MRKHWLVRPETIKTLRIGGVGQGHSGPRKATWDIPVRTSGIDTTGDDYVPDTKDMT